MLLKSYEAFTCQAFLEDLVLCGWYIDTGAARSGSSFKVYTSLPTSAKFSLSSANSAIALANRQQAKTHDAGRTVVHLGNNEYQMHVIVAEVEDEGVLGMDFLPKVDSSIDIVKSQLSINGEVFDCSDFKNQPLSSRCIIRRSTMIEPNTEVIVPVLVHKRSFNVDPKSSHLGTRLLKPCMNSHMH